MLEFWGFLALLGIPFIFFTAIYLTILERRLRDLERRCDEDNTS